MMFPNAAQTASAPAPSWMVDHHQLLLAGSSDVLDYTSFSDDSQSPVLSLQSYGSQQHSPDLNAYCFDDFEPLASSAAAEAMAFQSSLPTAILSVTTPQSKPTSAETARQAALLHAYLSAQNEAYNKQIQMQQEQQQQPQSDNFQWDLTALVQASDEGKHQSESRPSSLLSDASTSAAKVLDRTQQLDAENLTRYLAQLRQIKEEETTHPEHDVASPEAMSDVDDSESVHAPSSASSVRSSSPEASLETPSSLSSKTATKTPSSRQLVCFNCHVTQTPLWRRTPDRQHSLCNACGLYYKQYGAHRPLNVRHKLPSVLADTRLTLPYSRPVPRGSSSGPESSASSSSSESDSESVPSGMGTPPRSIPDLTKMYTDALIRPAAQKTSPPLMTAKQGIECANCSQTQTPLWRKNEAGEPICNACGLYAKLHNRARPVTMRKSKITRRRRDWGGNLAHQAQAQAQALALFHAQVQAQVEAQVKGGETASAEVSMVQEMSRRAQELNGRTALPTTPSTVSSDSEEEHSVAVTPKPATQSLSSGNNNNNNNNNNSNGVAQKLSGNLIMDEHKFSDMVGQMNGHQMNRFLSILESRCGVLRNRILASTEGSAQDSSLDNLF